MAGADYKDLRNVAIGLFIFTFFVTCYRCFARYKKGLWGRDDSVALFSMLSFIFFVIGSVYLAQESSREGRVRGAYILIFGFYTPVWGGRISIVLTVVRVTPWKFQKKILRWVAAFFVVQYLMLTIQAYWVCEITYPGWKKIPGSICVLPQAVPITQLVTTIVSDAILMVTPLMIVRGVHVPALRFRLLFIFSMSITTTLASVAHAVLVMTSPGVWEAIFGGVEAAVSVTVCSTSVIIPAILRALNVGDLFMQEDTVDPNFNTSIEIPRMTSTTIELGLPNFRGIDVTDSDEFEGASGTVVSQQQRGSVELDPKDDRKHRLTIQTSDGSLGNSGTATLAGESDIADSLTQARSLPMVEQDRDIEADVGGKVGRNSV